MTIHDKLAARLRSTPACLRDGNSASSTTVYGPWQDAADALADTIEAGDFDDVLGVREPTIDDVKREAVRAHGFGVAVWVDDEKCVKVDTGPLVWRAPTIAAAYAALRALPDWKGEG